MGVGMTLDHARALYPDRRVLSVWSMGDRAVVDFEDGTSEQIVTGAAA